MFSSAEDHAEQQIARVRALSAEIRRSLFVEFTPERILDRARQQDQRKANGESLPLLGLTITIKDLFDEQGELSSAASRLLRDSPTASRNSVAVQRLLDAGAVPFGRSTMSEFAYSGVGLNPHYGNPESVFGDGLISGGSTSGGAVSVARGLCDAALGTDTGGSCRIPAAANGLFGIKPSMRLIPRDGVQPLASSYDTVGVLAPELGTVQRLVEILAAVSMEHPTLSKAVKLAIPEGVFTDSLSDDQKQWFDSVCIKLEQSGFDLDKVPLHELNEAAASNRLLVSHEALSVYGEHLDTLESIGDPLILARMRYALEFDAASIEGAYTVRDEIISLFNERMNSFDAMICPTLPEAIPSIAATTANFDYWNPRMLQNTALLNLTDACALACPVPAGGRQSLMIAAPHGRDRTLFGVAERVLKAL